MYKLTSLVGDPVGASVGLDEGEADGPFEGDAEGILLGAFDGAFELYMQCTIVPSCTIDCTDHGDGSRYLDLAAAAALFPFAIYCNRLG